MESPRLSFSKKEKKISIFPLIPFHTLEKSTYKDKWPKIFYTHTYIHNDTMGFGRIEQFQNISYFFI